MMFLRFVCVCDFFRTDEEAQSVAYPFPGFCDLKHTVVQRFSSNERTNDFVRTFARCRPKVPQSDRQLRALLLISFLVLT